MTEMVLTLFDVPNQSTDTWESIKRTKIRPC